MKLCPSCGERLDATTGPCGACGTSISRIETLQATAPTQAPRRTRVTPVASLFARQFRLLRVIGTGSTGHVYEAEDLHLGRRVALKCLDERLAQLPGMREAMLREARTLAAVRHECVLAVHQFGEQGGIPFLVTELVDGRSLESMLHGRPLELGLAARIVRDAAHGLEALHRAGIVHRDVAPSNLLVRRSGRAVLVDAGLACALGPAARSEVLWGGSLGYAPPDQIEGADLPSVGADVYGLAATAFHALTGTPPFPADDVDACVLAQRSAPPSIAAIRPELRALEPTFERALAPEPERRFASVAELRASFELALAAAIRQRAQGARVLVVSRDRMVRVLVRACAGEDTAAPVDVRVAADGAEALRVATEERPAVIVFDLDLRSADTASLLTALRSAPHPRRMPLVIVGTGLRGSAPDLRHLDVVVLPKPIDLAALAAALTSALSPGALRCGAATEGAEQTPLT